MTSYNIYYLISRHFSTARFSVYLVKYFTIYSFFNVLDRCNNDFLFFLFQTQQWPHVEQQVWQSPTFHPNSQIHHHWGQQAIDNRSLNVMQQAVPYSAPAHLPTRTFAPNLQARITRKLHTLNLKFNRLVYLTYFNHIYICFCLCSDTQYKWRIQSNYCQT